MPSTRPLWNLRRYILRDGAPGNQAGGVWGGVRVSAETLQGRPARPAGRGRGLLWGLSAWAVAAT